MAGRRMAPLRASWMAASILGFIISVFYVSKWSEAWAWAFALVFLCMFIAAIVSMQKASPDEQLRAR